MSHVKNMQAFGKLTGICTGLGGTYNPGQQNLQANAMAAQLNIAQQIWENVKEAEIAYDTATNEREQRFLKIRRLSSNVCSMLKSCGADPLLLADAVNCKRRIWGAQISKLQVAVVEKTDQEIPTGRPSYSRAYVTLAEYFDKLVKTVGSESRYCPNEPDLTLTGLQQTLAELFHANQAVIDAEVRLEEARIRRNTLYYIAPGNMVDTAIAVRNYVRSAFGFQSQEHQQLQKLRFIKPNL